MSTWRTGRKVGRTVYVQQGDAPSDADPLIGVMDSPELAWQAVEAVNGCAGALLSLAAWFDRNERETAAETNAHRERGGDDAGCMAAGARDAWRDAAREARLRAGAGGERGSHAQPVTPDTGQAQGHSGDLSAADGITAAAEAMHDIINDGEVVTGLAERLADAARFLEIAGRDAVAAERARIAQLLDRKRAVFCRPCDGEVCNYGDELAPASELVRGGGDEA